MIAQIHSATARFANAFYSCFEEPIVFWYSAGSVRQSLLQNKIWPHSHLKWESELGKYRQPGPPQGGERIAGNSWLCNIHPEFRYGKPRIDFLLELKRYTLRVNGVGCFPDKPIERSAVLTGTDSGQRRLGSYGGPLRSRNDHKVVAQCGSLSGLWRGSGWAEAAGRSSAVRAWICESEGG